MKTGSFDINKLLRPHIRQLKPYSSARDEYSGTEGIFLDANENPLGSITEENFNRYPDPYQWALKSRISEIKGVAPERIFLGNGSDEAIDLLYRAFCIPGRDNVLLLPPTYGMYEVSANINDVAVKKINLTTDFQIDIANVLKAIDENTKVIFICSPNNPSGNKFHRKDIYAILKAFQGIVVVDEAYIDFSDEPSFTEDLDQYPNLLVLQTFSKAWGLASLRLGMAFASAEIIRIFSKIKPPYNISGLTQDTVLQSLKDTKKMENMVGEILRERDYLESQLQLLPEVQNIHPSHANFLLVKIEDARKTYETLVANKIIVRDRSNVTLCEECLRITVGTREENDKLIETLKMISTG
ncbi:histidinol-phosphate transaminase [Negadavirga shengliensis]|uniref:Histidinol-phosphate aminotransferase n=1 Tax=Negadavirga shengliensis TaxID=1389218 RepID=A0ABV9T6Y3_9BACT